MTNLVSVLRGIKQRVQTLATPRPEPVDPQRITVQALTESAALEVAQRFPEPDDPQYARALAAQTQGLYTIYIARIDTQPVGLAYVMWAGHRNARVRQRQPDAPEIYKVQVAATHRSRGIGALMINHIEQDMRARGITVSCLGVHAHNLRAKTLYERLGYRADAAPYFDEYDEPGAHGQVQHHRIEAILMSKLLR